MSRTKSDQYSRSPGTITRALSRNHLNKLALERAVSISVAGLTVLCEWDGPCVAAIAVDTKGGLHIAVAGQALRRVSVLEALEFEAKLGIPWWSDTTALHKVVLAELRRKEASIDLQAAKEFRRAASGLVDKLNPGEAL